MRIGDSEPPLGTEQKASLFISVVVTISASSTFVGYILFV